MKQIAVKRTITNSFGKKLLLLIPSTINKVKATSSKLSDSCGRIPNNPTLLNIPIIKRLFFHSVYKNEN